MPSNSRSIAWLGSCLPCLIYQIRMVTDWVIHFHYLSGDLWANALRTAVLWGNPLQGSKKAAVALWGKCTLSKKAAVAL